MTKLRSYLAAAVLPLILAAGACGPSQASQEDRIDPQAAISVNNAEPTAPLIPSSTNDTAGWKVVTQLFDGLVTFDAKGGMTLVEAKSITPNEDASQYTIVLKPGLTFSDGEQITAKTYADPGPSRRMRPMGSWAPRLFRPSPGTSRCRMSMATPRLLCPVSGWSTT